MIYVRIQLQVEGEQITFADIQDVDVSGHVLRRVQAYAILDKALDTLDLPK